MSALPAARLSVLGAGSWGTALAILLARNGHRVRLWGHDPDIVAILREEGCNRRYLPDVPFPAELDPVDDLTDCLAEVPIVLLAVPTHAFREVLSQMRRELAPGARVAWATKGLEAGTGRFLHQVFEEVMDTEPAPAVISGPSFAKEVAAGLPTAVTVASVDAALAEEMARLLSGPDFRTYTTTDVQGVELGGAVKNVMAIAAGIADGLGFGANTRAALITRGLHEIMVLGERLGGQRETFMGLSGIGDLVLTCTDDQSRNRRLGLALGRGERPKQAMADIGQAVEGFNTAKEVVALARQHGVEMPISEQVFRVLYRDQDPRAAVDELLGRALRAEEF